MSAELRGVLAGAGFFAQFHAEAWRRVPGVRITAVADPEAGRRASFAAQWGIPACYDAVEEMLDGERPDFVDIVTRPDSHLHISRAAAARGVHVICQKPMAPTIGECRDMVSACRQAGVRLIMHENWRWQPWYREVRKLIDAGFFGGVLHLAARIRTGDGRGPEPYRLQPYFREMPHLLVHETLVHYLDTFRFLAGEVGSVFCVTQRINPAIRGEDSALIVARFSGGAQGIIDANRIAGPDPPPNAFGEFRVEGARAAARITPDGDLWKAEYGCAESPHVFDKPACGYKGDSVHALQMHIRDSLCSGKPAESEGADYLKTVALVEACYRSAASGREETAE